MEGLLPNKLYAWSGSKLFDTLMVLGKEMQMTKTSMQIIQAQTQNFGGIHLKLSWDSPFKRNS